MDDKKKVEILKRAGVTDAESMVLRNMVDVIPENEIDDYLTEISKEAEEPATLENIKKGACPGFEYIRYHGNEHYLIAYYC